MNALTVENLVKRYRSPDGGSHAVVDVTHFELDAGDQAALRGASGSGKTTFLNLIAGILRADAGRVAINGEPMTGLSAQRIMEVVKTAAGPGMVETSVLTQYDRYYLDRRRVRPLPVVLAQFRDAQNTRFYIDPRTARVVGSYDDSAWVNRWLYNGLHSLNFPWLYNYRPLWDIVVITFMVGGTALCVTSLILAWRVVGRKLRGVARGTSRDRLSDDFALAD